MDNDGSYGAYIHYDKFPTGIYIWTVTSYGMWIGRSYGSLGVFIKTTTHSYGWGGDGYYPEHEGVVLQSKLKPTATTKLQAIELKVW